MTVPDDSQTGSAQALVVGATSGVLTFIVFFGLGRAIGTDATYLWPAGDLAQHVAGAFAYIDGAWTFPIFHTDRINAPDGVNIIFTDSAPFAGLLAKLVHSVTGLRFNYLGAWFAISWVGQAMAGAYLMRQLAGRGLFLYFCGAIIALSFPAYLNRHFHLALGSHFLLLFAFGLYFVTIRARLTIARAVAWACLLGVAIWTHAYLFVMSAALFAAALGDSVVRGTLTARHAIGTLLGILAFCVFLALVGGYGSVGNINAGGYGAFRMDLLAYVWPHGSALFPMPVIFDAQSAYEGYNYIGLGGIIVAAMSILLIRRKHLDALAAHPLLLLAVIGMAIFAITNAVSFAGKVLIHPGLPTDGFPFSTLRASGRLGWPLGYLAVFAALALVVNALRQYRRVAALGAVGLIAAIQFADSTQLLQGMQQGWQSEPKPALEAALVGIDRVHFAPPIDCLPSGAIQNAAIEMLAVVARTGIVSDDAHMARADTSHCGSVATDNELPNSLVIVIPDTLEAQFYTQHRQCIPEAGALICSLAEE